MNELGFWLCVEFVLLLCNTFLILVMLWRTTALSEEVRELRRIAVNKIEWKGRELWYRDYCSWKKVGDEE